MTRFEFSASRSIPVLLAAGAFSLIEITGCDSGSTTEPNTGGTPPSVTTGGTHTGGTLATGGVPPSSGGGGGGGGAAGGAAPGSGGATSVAGAGAGGLQSQTGGSGGAPGGSPGNGGNAPTAGAELGGTAGVGTGGGMSEGGKFGTGKHLFPENQRLGRCSYPTKADPYRAYAAYERWLKEIVTSEGAQGFRRLKRPDSPDQTEPNTTVSEGMAYGMLIAVAVGDQELFDDFWQYSQKFVNGNGLMNWYVNAAGTQVLGTGAASDADEDMAWALIMADRNWGGQGSLDKPYIELAKEQIQRIWDHEVDHERGDLFLPGDEWNEPVFNPSYFAPNQYRLFGQVTGKVAEWNRVIDTGYETLFKCLNSKSGNADNGLVPAWCNPDGTPYTNRGAYNYQYDSARMPFRIGQDYCYNGEPRALEYLQKVSAFFANVGAANMVDGYTLDGKPQPDPKSDPNGPQSAVFVGTAAVGAMHDAKFQPFIDEAYDLVQTGNLLARSTYYNQSWTVLTLLMLTGNLNEWSAP